MTEPEDLYREFELEDDPLEEGAEEDEEDNDERQIGMTHTLLNTERVLEDDYPINPEYVYICDNKFKRFDGEDEITVAHWKRICSFKEIRRCDLFAREGARLGDSVE